MRKVYLDHNATTPVRPEVLEAMLPYFNEKFGNASSFYQSGQEAKAALEEAREKVAGIIGAAPREIIFTSGGTESDNLAVKGTAFANRKKGMHIITSKIEHPAVLESCKFLEKEGFEVTYLPVDSKGFVDPEDLGKAICDDTTLVSIIHANNEVGTVQPIEKLCLIAKDKGAYFHTDAVQTVGKLPIDLQKLNVDLLTVSGHKIYGPKGIGILYVRKGVRITPWAHGGHHEHSKRAGTENVFAIVGLAKALELIDKEMEENNQRLKNLTETFYRKLAESIPNVILHGDLNRRITNTLSLSFAGVEGESIILSLDMKGVEVSTGSACSSGTLEPSHVLSAMGMDPAIAQGAIRFSFGKDNTMDDVAYVTGMLPEIVQRLRSISPIYAAREKSKKQE
jgi:cysteine desulfurase